MFRKWTEDQVFECFWASLNISQTIQSYQLRVRSRFFSKAYVHWSASMAALEFKQDWVVTEESRTRTTVSPKNDERYPPASGHLRFMHSRALIYKKECTARPPDDKRAIRTMDQPKVKFTEYFSDTVISSRLHSWRSFFFVTDEKYVQRHSVLWITRVGIPHTSYKGTVTGSNTSSFTSFWNQKLTPHLNKAKNSNLAISDELRATVVLKLFFRSETWRS